MGYKTLGDNSALRRKIDAMTADSSDVRAVVAIGGRDPDAGERKMMSDFGLTESELFAGLEGVPLPKWALASASEAGVAHPASNPSVRKAIVTMQQLNASAHNVSYDDYLVMADAVIRNRLKLLYGSKMTGEEYLKRDTDASLMDWSSIEVPRPKNPERIPGARKELSPNAPTDDIFTMAGGVPEYTWEQYEADERTVAEGGTLEKLPDFAGVLRSGRI